MSEITPTRHAQALARIEHNQKHNTGWLDDNDFTEGKVNPFYAALKAVLELPNKEELVEPVHLSYFAQGHNEALSIVHDLIISGVLGE